jgi:hypothetical protein
VIPEFLDDSHQEVSMRTKVFQHSHLPCAESSFQAGFLSRLMALVRLSRWLRKLHSYRRNVGHLLIMRSMRVMASSLFMLTYFVEDL